MQKITIVCSEDQAAPVGIYLMSNGIEFSAECCGDASSASDNTASDAIALLDEMLEYHGMGDFDSWIFNNRERINAVVAQQHQ